MERSSTLQNGLHTCSGLDLISGAFRERVAPVELSPVGYLSVRVGGYCGKLVGGWVSLHQLISLATRI